MSDRKVRFHEDDDALAKVVFLIPSLDDFTPEDHENLWFSKADYHMCRAEAKVISRECVRLGYSKNLDNTYTEKNTVAQEQLQEWTTVDMAIRGLERWANKAHGELRQTDQLDAVMAILEAQDEMLACTKNCRIVDVEKLRKVSSKVTKTARHFARMMGKADSLVVEAELGRGLPSSSPQKASRRKLKDSSSSFRDAETVSTECTTRTGSINDSPDKLLKSGISNIEISDDESLSMIDGIKGMQSGARFNTRFRRFGFGKSNANRQQGNKLDDARVSRPA
jgi:hypothetical protein